MPFLNFYDEASDSDVELYEEPPKRQPRMTKVNFPSGLSLNISIPARPCTHNRCDFDHTVTILNKKGPGWRERHIVRKTMLSTIVEHLLQENGGGLFSSYNVTEVFKIHNHCLWRRFRAKQAAIAAEVGYCNEKMLFHGSKNANSIISRGFDMGRADPRGMFGKAIYFAQHSSKSNQYVFGYLGGNGCPDHKNKNCYVCERVQLLCRVTLGRWYKQHQALNMATPPPEHHSVFGEPSATGSLRYPEYAVYDADQVYPEYMIFYKIVK